MTFYIMPSNSDLIHYGIKGQKWGIRRFQNPDGTLTAEGKERYSSYADPKKGILDKYPGKDPVDAVGDHLINDPEARKRWIELNAQYHVAYQKYYWNNTKNSSKKENEDRLSAAEQNIDKFIKNLFGSEYLNKLSDSELLKLVIMEANEMAYTDDIHKEAWSLAYKIDSDAMDSEEKYRKNKIAHSEGDRIMPFYITSSNSDLMHYGIKGQKWGIRRFQNPDKTLTEEGKKRYGKNLFEHNLNESELERDFARAERRAYNRKDMDKVKTVGDLADKFYALDKQTQRKAMAFYADLVALNDDLHTMFTGRRDLLDLAEYWINRAYKEKET